MQEIEEQEKETKASMQDRVQAKQEEVKENENTTEKKLS